MLWIDLDDLTHWGRVTHICVSKLTIIGSDNGLSPGWRQAIIWNNAGILLIRHLGTNFNEILIKILTFSFIKMRLKVSSAKWRPFCIGLNVLIVYIYTFVQAHVMLGRQYVSKGVCRCWHCRVSTAWPWRMGADRLPWCRHSCLSLYNR